MHWLFQALCTGIGLLEVFIREVSCLAPPLRVKLSFMMKQLVALTKGKSAACTNLGGMSIFKNRLNAIKWLLHEHKRGIYTKSIIGHSMSKPSLEKKLCCFELFFVTWSGFAL